VTFLAAAAIAFGVIVLVELPDKTLVATLVLSTRYRPRPVLVGVAAAFALQCAIAVTAGSVITLLPRRAVEAVVAALFAIGAVLLIRESLEPDDDDVELAEHRESRPFWRIVLTCFGVLFAAEWGDASQLATASLAARIGNPFAVGVGAFTALVVVAGLAVFIGAKLRSRIRPKLIQRCAGFAFAGFAAFALVQLAF